MKKIISLSSIAFILITTIPVAEARIFETGSLRNFSQRGYRRTISKSRDLAKEKCEMIEDADEKNVCRKVIKETARSIDPMNPATRDELQSELDKRCGHITNIGFSQACVRNQRNRIPQTARPDFAKRTTRRDAKKKIAKCKALTDTAERLRCRNTSDHKRAKGRRPQKRRRFEERGSVEFISPNGLRRSLSRERDLVNEQCSDITNGNEKRACIKRVKEEVKQF